MKFYQVIPLTKISIRDPQVLTYKSKEALSPGSLVLIPLKTRYEKGIVKEALKKPKKKLKIKPIEKVLLSSPVVSPTILTLAEKISEEFLEPLGLVLKLFLPRVFFTRKRLEKLNIPDFPKKKTTKKQPKPILLWSDDRWNYYKKEIQKTLKQNKQILFLVPEIEKIDIFKNLLFQLTNKVEVFHSDIRTKKEFEIWQNLIKGKIQIVIGTRSAIFLPFSNLGLIILDEEESSSYKSWEMHPRYHTKKIAFLLASQFQSHLILGTSLPSIESFYLAKTKQIKLIEKYKKPKTKIELVDQREEIRFRNFSVFSRKLQTLLSQKTKEKTKILLFVNRKGLAPTIFCRNCGYTLKCKHCEAPLVYHKKGLLVCHHCGYEIEAPGVCPKCGSWKLRFFGVGTQRVFDALKKARDNFWENKEINIFRLDGDIPKKRQKEIINYFQKSESGILVTTSAIFKYPDLYFDLSAVVFIDNLLNFPDFQIEERVFHILFKLQSISKEMLVQTYKPDFPLFQFFQKGKIKEFFQKELKERKRGFFPPFSEVIKLTYKQKSKEKGSQKIEKIQKIVEKLFKKHEILGPAPAFIPKVKGKYLWHLIIKIPQNQKKRVKELLNYLPRTWSIDVNPESLL